VLLRHDIEYALVRNERWFRHLLELHWGVLWGGSFDRGAAEDLWSEAQPKACFGVPAYTLSPEGGLLFLAAHAARHQWRGLKWLVDVHEICAYGKIDWDTVWDKAQHLGWEDVLCLTLSACHTLFDTPLPAPLPLKVLPPWVRLFPADP